MDKKFFLEVPDYTVDYINNLKSERGYIFKPALGGLTEYGELLSLGFSCYALKIYYMTSEWNKLNAEKKKEWRNYINSFQLSESDFPINSFIDPYIVKGYKNLPLKKNINYLIKGSLNFLPSFNFDSKRTDLQKAINAETKQAVATLNEVGYRNEKEIESKYSDENILGHYLNSLDWSKPWSAGAQFSSICVFTETQKLNFYKYLENFISKKANSDTGSYYSRLPSDPREVINGAMKVISGLDWLNIPIHYPKKLIDYCLSNQPVLEGCDVVDYVYVLYKCSSETNYRRSEINKLFEEIFNIISSLYVPEDGAFSYFVNKSQTHYYGIEITNGLNRADIHGTTLSLWAIIMMLKSLDISEKKLKVIKP